MASYADIAAKGPHQSPEEARAPPMPELERSDDSVHSLVDVDSPHISSVPSDFEAQSVKTDTQAERLAHEAEDAELRRQREEEQQQKTKKERARARAEQAREKVGHPVVLGNSVAIVALGAVLGYGAWRRYQAGLLNWRVVGVGAGVVGLFAAADYYLSKYLFKKYPTK
jgi:cation transport ATPase